MAKNGQNKPNVVFILVDDLGWSDLGCQGSKYYETPHIDQLAAEGMRFTNAYAACTVCSPTRASIMTGKYPARLNLTDWISGHDHPWAKFQVPDWTQYLSHDETSLASAFREAGYNTYFTGKWHLGGPEYYPEKHGFDVNIGGCERGLPPTYFSPYGIETLEEGPEGEYLTDRLTEEALRLMEQSQDEPFFMYLSHYAVHTPIEAKEEDIEKYEGKEKHGQLNEVYAAMVDSTDQSVGRIMDKLEELGIADDTIVVFFSDNGGYTPVTNNTPLRHGKGSAYEGGHRVPMIVRWPDQIHAGSVDETPVISMDFYPTLLDACGISLRPDQHCDGENLVPLLRGDEAPSREALYWHYPHYHFSTPYAAVRAGDYKLIEYFEGRRAELYNLDDDLSEENDLAEGQPEKVRELRAKLHSWQESVDAQMPIENPRFEPDKRYKRPGAPELVECGREDD